MTNIYSKESNLKIVTKRKHWMSSEGVSPQKVSLIIIVIFIRRDPDVSRKYQPGPNSLFQFHICIVNNFWKYPCKIRGEEELS